MNSWGFSRSCCFAFWTRLLRREPRWPFLPTPASRIQRLLGPPSRAPKESRHFPAVENVDVLRNPDCEGGERAFSLELTGIAVRGHSGLAGITIDRCGMQACPRERTRPLERRDTAGSDHT